MGIVSECPKEPCTSASLMPTSWAFSRVILDYVSFAAWKPQRLCLCLSRDQRLSDILCRLGAATRCTFDSVRHHSFIYSL